MALNTKTKASIPADIEVEEVSNGQVSFDDLVFDGEFEEEREAVQYFTISGKEQQYEPTWERYGILDLDIGDEFEGRPELTHFINDDRKSDSIRVRVMDDGEIVDLYINIPKPDEQGFITNIRKGFDFYRKAFDFIYSVLRYIDESNVIDKNGEEINVFKRVNIINFAKFVDQKERIGVRITEGNTDSEYNSFIIYKME